MSSLLKGQGVYPLYFSKPEKSLKFFDEFHFSPGFRRALPDGLAFYIHRAKNKKEAQETGVIPILLSDQIDKLADSLKKFEFHSQLETINQQKQIQLRLPDHKIFIIYDGKLPYDFKKAAPPNNFPFQASGHCVIRTKDPQKAMLWYKKVWGCQSEIINQETCISYLNVDTQPKLLLVHQKEHDRKKIGPVNHPIFLFKANDCYQAWNYFKEKKLLPKGWGFPKADGFWRIFTFSAPDGYLIKVYGKSPVYPLEIAADLIHQRKEELLISIESNELVALPQKYKAQEEKWHNSYLICEDELLKYLWKKSPYQNQLRFPSGIAPQHLSIAMQGDDQ